MIKARIDNIILCTDSYKLNHWKQYPEDTEAVYSYFESRVGADYPETIFFGLQYILKNYLVGKVIERRDIEVAASLAADHFGSPDLFNRKGWEHILGHHGGKLPLRIKAVAEGTAVPTGNVLMTVENTCPDCYWLTNAMESLLTHVWAPSTVATISHHVLKMIEGYVLRTGGDPAGVKFQLHDFGYRGASSHESAAIAGAGHLVNGLGTDTLPAIMLLSEYYAAETADIAYSVPATEHSVMTALGEKGEMEIVDRLIENYPTGILSVVADSYDVYKFVEYLGYRKRQIMERDGKFVVRPDSGEPLETMVKLSQMLWARFGGTANDKGYKVFDPHVGLLWGDGLEPAVIEEILETTTAAGFCASNYVFGMGGGLLQKINRDMQRFAFKCSAQKRDGEWRDIFKDPLDHSKASKRGRLQLEETKGKFYTTQLLGIGKNDSGANLLKTVFENGELVNTYSLAEVRENASNAA
jgi:nicotinamide phosphoribosyltransferase